MKTIEIKNSNGEVIHSLKVEDNYTVTVENGVTVVEEKKEFKKGDFLFKDYGEAGNKYVILFSHKIDCLLYYSAYLRSSVELVIENDFGLGRVNESNLRLATPSERQQLIDKLHEVGKDLDADKLEIVDLKYVPKVGDCVKATFDGSVYFFEVTEVIGNKVIGSESVKNGEIYEPIKWWLGVQNCTETKITPEELQAEFNKLGYEYDFDTHTAKKMEWKPKVGEIYYCLDWNKPVTSKWDNTVTDNLRLKLNMVFRTKELAEAALETIKNLPHA